ncbi:hypothetical protein F2P81_014052 [Scophthalmus maximus]|uniref:Uncharacterized protein n=1 Tax=Scophthalmus maximus TaxID=52904 RepID=A0A6A4SFQ5_SCOMX|nr:hypothetical protein F2P81_014052 [Scophthalmus maximus]
MPAWLCRHSSAEIRRQYGNHGVYHSRSNSNASASVCLTVLTTVYFKISRLKIRADVTLFDTRNVVLSVARRSAASSNAALAHLSCVLTPPPPPPLAYKRIFFISSSVINTDNVCLGVKSSHKD